MRFSSFFMDAACKGFLLVSFSGKKFFSKYFYGLKIFTEISFFNYIKFL
jgi:hypothetical protein